MQLVTVSWTNLSWWFTFNPCKLAGSISTQKQRLFFCSMCFNNDPRNFSTLKCWFNGLDWSLLVKHLDYEDIHNSWLYCFTNPLELGTRVSLSHRQPNVLLNNLTMFLQYNRMCATLLTGRDDGRFYPKKWPRKFPANFGEIKVFREMWREQ